MSTEADIVIKALRQQRGGATLFDETTGKRLGMAYELAADLITRLRAERDAAARDMRERCANVADDEASRWGMKVGSSARNAARMIRALPDTDPFFATDQTGGAA